jgi:2-keto-3-deoxy-L-rhamnonate aldolase RhmA
MEMPVNRFKRSLAGSVMPVGTWLMSASTAAAEGLCCLGFDFVVIDTEHVPVDAPQVLALLQAVAGTPAQAIVRLAWNDAVLVKRAMDMGAQTLMFPFVQSADEARRAVASARYPPDGTRGFAAMHRASRYGTVTDFARRANAEACVVIQIETPAAIEQLEVIAGVDGVDALFAGPGDLAAACGHIGDIGHADVQRHLRAVAAACRRLGKPCGTVGSNPEMVKRFIEYGYSFVAVASDLGMMMRQAGEYLGELRRITGASGAPGP